LAASFGRFSNIDEGAVGGAIFVLSLDFELLRGVRDKRTIADYGANILGVRRAIPAMLDMFTARQIRCTWATVGFLFCADKDELLASFPRALPHYRDSRLSPYDDLADLGRNEESDPYRYGLSMLRQIQERPGQEIATHTFSHYYCLEEGADFESFRADLAAAQQVAERRGVRLKSIVFPRNQISPAHLRLCRQMGFTAFRGNERVWFHAARPDREQNAPMRGFRLADSYLPLGGAHVHRPELVENMVDVASSRFLRPAGNGGPLEKLRLRRITSAMESAARQASIFHLWWHPHNFGGRLDDNLSVLGAILDRFADLNARYGMRSLCMADVADETLNGQATGAAARG
jgi:hypothetical protein